MGRKRELPFSYGIDLLGASNQVDEPLQQNKISDKRARPDQLTRDRSSNTDAHDLGTMSEAQRDRPTQDRSSPDRRRPVQPRRERARAEQPQRPGRRRRPQPGRARRSWAQRALLGTGMLSVLLLLLVFGVAVYAMVKYLSIERLGDLGVDAAAPDEPRNYLVVGSDERNPQGPLGSADTEDVQGRRSDALVVIRVDAQAGEAALLSVPRDLVVPIAGTGEEQRINSAYGIDRATLVDTVRDALDIVVHHYVEVDFTSFETLVDALGGVEVYLDRAIRDDASGLYVEDLGCVTLDGEQALAFVRSRQLQYMTSSGSWSGPDPTADLGRIQRQQIFVGQALGEALRQVRSSPVRIPELVDVGVGAVAIDDKMSVRELIAIGEALADLDADGFETHSLPVVERGDGATLALDDDEADQVLDYFRTDRDDQSDESDGGPASSAPPPTAPSSHSDFVLGAPPDGVSC